MSTRRVRFAGGLAVLAVVASVGGTILVRREEPVSVSGRFTHPRFGWTIDVPSGFRAFPIRVDSINGETGVLVSNFEVEEPWSLAEFRDFPSDGAALCIWSLEGLIGTPLPEDDARLPLDLTLLEETTRYVGMSEPRPLFGSVNGAGHSYYVAVWYGPNASEDDRAEVESALRSVSFSLTEPGSVIGHRLIVGAPAAEYAIGSVTRYDREDLLTDATFADYGGPFRVYLVRGTTGSYGVATDFLGNGVKCDLRVEEDPLVLACPNEGWRWDRHGRVVEEGALWPDGTSDLLILPTPRSWDGNLMLDPFGNAPDEATAAWGR